jgi:chemotaxis protein histidine kinase CheA
MNGPHPPIPPPLGTLALAARPLKDRVEIKVSDDGTISVESREQVGTTFTIQFPTRRDL